MIVKGKNTSTLLHLLNHILRSTLVAFDFAIFFKAYLALCVALANFNGRQCLLSSLKKFLKFKTVS